MKMKEQRMRVVKTVGLMVTLNHTIFSQSPSAINADDWMLTEFSSPWAGYERALVTQKISSREGVLLTTSVQKGLARPRHDSDKAVLYYIHSVTRFIDSFTYPD